MAAERLPANGRGARQKVIGSIPLHPIFRRWLGGNYVCVGVGEFWERPYGVFVAGSER